MRTMRTIRSGARASDARVRAWILALGVALASASFAAPVSAQEDPAPRRETTFEPPGSPGPAPGPDGPMRRGPHGDRHRPPPLERVLEHHADRLRLDDETRARIRSIAEASRDAKLEYRQRIGQLRGEMRALLAQDSPDTDAVMRQAAKIGDAETEFQKHRLRTMLEIHQLLSPEQREELVEIHEERRTERGEHGRRMREPELEESQEIDESPDLD